MDYAIPILSVLAAISLAIDWRQTLFIAGNPDKYYEKGFAKTFIGEHPTKAAVNIYFAVATVIVMSLAAVAVFISEWLTVAIFIVTLVIQVPTIINNRKLFGELLP